MKSKKINLMIINLVNLGWTYSVSRINHVHAGYVWSRGKENPKLRDMANKISCL
jgi:hypothetical protein